MKLRYIFTLFFLLFSIFQGSALADDNETTVYLRAKMTEKPHKVTGLIITPNTVEKINQANIEYVAIGDYYLISYQVNNDILDTPDVYFSAIISSENSKMTLATVKDNESAITPPVTRICEDKLPQPIAQMPSKDKIVRLKEVISIREARLKNERNEFLSKLEKKIGSKKTVGNLLRNASRIYLGNMIDFSSNDLTPLEIVQALSKIEHIMLGQKPALQEKINNND